MPPLSSEITFFGGEISWNILLYPHYPLKNHHLGFGLGKLQKKTSPFDSVQDIGECGTSDHRPTKAVQQYCSVAAIAWFLKISTSVEVLKDTNRFGGTWGKHTEKCGKPMVSLKESAKGRFSTSMLVYRRVSYRSLICSTMTGTKWDLLMRSSGIQISSKPEKKQLPCQIFQTGKPKFYSNEPIISEIMFKMLDFKSKTLYQVMFSSSTSLPRILTLTGKKHIYTLHPSGNLTQLWNLNLLIGTVEGWSQSNFLECGQTACGKVATTGSQQGHSNPSKHKGIAFIWRIQSTIITNTREPTPRTADYSSASTALHYKQSFCHNGLIWEGVRLSERRSRIWRPLVFRSQIYGHNFNY